MKAFHVYRSSAGSGKTYRLVFCYLSLALSPGKEDRWQHILAITFTNKAANEMKSRILKALVDIADWKNGSSKPAMFDELLAETGLTPQQLSAEAGAVLRDILHHYDLFAVGTIDKFTHRMVRSFAHELRMPQDFEVVIEKDEIVERSVQKAYSDLGVDKPLTKVLKAFALYKVEVGQKWDVSDELRSFCSQIFSEEGQINMRQNKNIGTLEYLRLNKTLWRIQTQFERESATLGQGILDEIEQAGLDMNDFSGKSRSKVFRYSNYLLNPSRFNKFFDRLDKVGSYLDDDWPHAKCSTEARAAIDQIKARLCGLLVQAMDRFENKYKEYLLARLIRKNIYGQALLGKFREYVDQIISETGLVHLSAFNRNIAEHIAREPAAFIYEVLGARYDHILFDEFQDTSLLQWYNMIPILENGLSEGKLSLVVGDGKQAIYRFRNGRVEQLIDLPDITDNGAFPLPQGSGNSMRTQYFADRLSINRRSTPEIIKFNNQLFSLLKEHLDAYYQNIYHDHTEDAFRKSRGLVHFQGLPKSGFKDLALIKMLDFLNDCTEDGYQHGHVLILTRTNDESEMVAGFLLEKGIDFTSKESLRISGSAGIRMITGILKLSSDVNDKMAALEVMRTADELNWISLNEEERILNIENPENLLKKLFDQIPGAVPDYGRLPAYEAIECLASLFGLYDEPSAYLVSLLDFAHDVAGSVGQDIASFLMEWDQKKDHLFISIPDREDAVRIMTIHQSKGLEEKVVILPFCDWSPRSPGKIWFRPDGKEAEWGSFYINFSGEDMPVISQETADNVEQIKILDYLNVIYVALTRPRNRLYGCVPLHEDAEKNSLFVKALQQMDHWHAQKMSYLDGARVSEPGKQDQMDPVRIVDRLPYNDWRKRIRLKTGRPADNRYTDYGRLVHKLLSMMKRSEDLQKVMEEAQRLRLATPDLLEKASSELYLLFSHQDFVTLFDTPGEILNEVEILTREATVLRPDRIINGPERILVLDYKTGQEEAQHIAQISAYAKALKGIGSGKRVSAYLVYTGQATLKQVS